MMKLVIILVIFLVISFPAY
ncbi:type I toxin-antitoxin system Ibs family toxin [Citrobacter rodentium]|uniref:Type I toxin-antitoxin system Ibs family toxin n=1 Tax=Citrobacter rodentium TaxID=67825 RepID=A0A482PMI4_CITRO|nr:type I toxin-antitoxin system Ibs family toxin [Citrobacter rodentium]QBY31991.1 type I toxin-antitoxin system Ibs family toxin [Citrobacter rodentium]UHO33514.1 type I toxin-antitoxin system Ibs family toxin [Citrobacter rodentium NBRC 105723 = DSM 16636]